MQTAEKAVATKPGARKYGANYGCLWGFIQARRDGFSIALVASLD